MAFAFSNLGYELFKPACDATSGNKGKPMLEKRNTMGHLVFRVRAGSGAFAGIHHTRRAHSVGPFELRLTVYLPCSAEGRTRCSHALILFFVRSGSCPPTLGPRSGMTKKKINPVHRLVLPFPMLLKEAADYTRTLEMEGGRHDCLSSVATAHDQCRLHGRRRPRGHPSAMAGWRGRTGPRWPLPDLATVRCSAGDIFKN